MKRVIRYESVHAKTMMNAVKAPSMPFDWSINPYRGCQHGCSFCYARSTHAFLGIEADDTFQNHILLKANASDSLREQLRKMMRRKGAGGIGRIAVGTATDPYQQIEAKAGLTRSCLEVLADFPVPVSITTRSPLILRDLELLKRIRIESVNISIGTLRHEVWKQFEPSTPSPSQRLDTVRQLTESGIPAGVFLAPILPFITDGAGDLEELVRACADSGARFVMSSLLRLSTREVKVWFFQTLERHYPQWLEEYGRLYGNSAYVPHPYAEPIKKLMQELLNRYGLPAQEPFRGRPERPDRAPEGTDNAASAGEEPVQLSFAF